MKSVWTLVGASAAIYTTLALGMAVFPGFAMSKEKPTAGSLPLTAEQAAGRDAYVGEGCSYCHTQYVRPIVEDRVWGRPSVAGDYTYATPELFGTERNGPDLTNAGTRQPSEVWNYIHLYEPRALVSESIMPSYRYLFEDKAKAEPGETVVPIPPAFAPMGHVVVPTAEARALVAYIESLKQPLLRGSAP